MDRDKIGPIIALCQKVIALCDRLETDRKGVIKTPSTSNNTLINEIEHTAEAIALLVEHARKE